MQPATKFDVPRVSVSVVLENNNTSATIKISVSFPIDWMGQIHKGKGKAKVLGIAPLNERSRYQERIYNRGSGGWLALAIVSRHKVAASP